MKKIKYLILILLIIFTYVIHADVMIEFNLINTQGINADDKTTIIPGTNTMGYYSLEPDLSLGKIDNVSISDPMQPEETYNINIQLTPDGKRKLHNFTQKNIGNHMLLKIAKIEVSLARVIEPINTKSIMIPIPNKEDAYRIYENLIKIRNHK